MTSLRFFFFFFQAEDGIRDYKVTGVQTCALPISVSRVRTLAELGVPKNRPALGFVKVRPNALRPSGRQIGRASCRESVDLGGRRIIKKKKKRNKREDVRKQKRHKYNVE